MSKELNNNNKPNCRTAFALYARGQKDFDIFNKTYSGIWYIWNLSLLTLLIEW